ncbi:reverse transcriptase domain-containing protein [Tanacetum coccineum]
MKAQQATNSFVKETFMDLKTQLEITTKSHQASIQNLEAKFDKLADKKYARPSGSLPSSTQPNLRGNLSKPYQPPHARNEHVNAIFTHSGKSYDPPTNPSNLQNDYETPINFDSEDEDKESTPQPKSQTPKPVKETLIPKPYKPKIPYPQCLRKGKMEAQYGKFLDMIRAVRINVPFVDVLARIPNYGKFLKELVSNKHKLEQISSAFLSEESSAMIQNKVPPKLGEPGSLLILCNFNKAFSCNSLADLGASINLISYSLYAKLSLKTLKSTRMSVRLAYRSFQYPIVINENMLVEVGKFIFLVDFVILEMEEDSKVPLILGRPFLHTDDEVIRVKQKQLNLGVGTKRMIFHLDSAMKHSYSNDDTCFSIVIDEILKEDFDALLAMTADENSEEESVEEPPMDLELKPLPDNLEYVFLEEPSFLPVIISSQLLEQNKKGIVLGHKVSRACLEVDKSKIDVISKLPPSTNVKGIRSFLGHAGFYRCFIKDFSKIACPLTKLLEKDTPFEFDDECHNAFKLLKEKLTCAPVIVSPNWNLPFELMIDASDFAIGAVLGQKDGKHFHPIYFASKTLNATQQRYTVTEKELMVVVFAFDKF